MYGRCSRISSARPEMYRTFSTATARTRWCLCSRYQLCYLDLGPQSPPSGVGADFLAGVGWHFCEDFGDEIGVRERRQVVASRQLLWVLSKAFPLARCVHIPVLPDRTVPPSRSSVVQRWAHSIQTRGISACRVPERGHCPHAAQTAPE